MRASLPSIPAFKPLQAAEPFLDKLRHHQAEIAVLSGMAVSLSLMTGGALSVLFSPNLGQQLLFPSILKPGSLQEGRMSMFGNTILELSRPLRIEIVDEATSRKGPDAALGRQASASEQASTEALTEALTIVSPAEFQPQLLEEAQKKGTQLLLLTLLALGGLYGSARLMPRLLLLGPQRRKPLGERLAKSRRSLPNHPLAAKVMTPPDPEPVRRARRTVPAGAFVRLGPMPDFSGRATSGDGRDRPQPTVIPPNAFETFEVATVQPPRPTAVTLPTPAIAPRRLIPPNLGQPQPARFSLPADKTSRKTGGKVRGKTAAQKRPLLSQLRAGFARPKPSPLRIPSPQPVQPQPVSVQPVPVQSAPPPPPVEWLSGLDVRSDQPLTSLL